MLKIAVTKARRLRKIRRHLRDLDQCQNNMLGDLRRFSNEAMTRLGALNEHQNGHDLEWKQSVSKQLYDIEKTLGTMDRAIGVIADSQIKILKALQGEADDGKV